MSEYVKIKSGDTTATMTNSEYQFFVDLIRANESPGDGWYLVEKVLPKPVPGNNEQLAYTYTIENNVARKTYFTVPSSKSFLPRKFSKYKIVENLMKANLWSSVKAWIEQSGLIDLYLAAQDFSEDNQYFKNGRRILQQQFGISDEEVERILSESVAEK